MKFFLPGLIKKNRSIISEYIEDEEDVDIVIGERFILAKASEAFIKRTGNACVFRADDSLQNYSYSKSNFLFSIEKRQWFLHGKGGKKVFH
jgi:hypothetical protein